MRYMEWNQITGKALQRKYLSLVGDEHIINLLHAKVFAFSKSIVFCKDEREPSIKHCMGTEIGVVQKFNGIRVEYLPRIQCVAAQSRSQTFTVEIDWDTREFHRKDYLHVDVQRHHMWIKRQQSRMRVKLPVSFLYLQEELEQDSGHFLVLVQRKSGILSVNDSPQGD